MPDQMRSSCRGRTNGRRPSLAGEQRSDSGAGPKDHSQPVRGTVSQTVFSPVGCVFQKQRDVSKASRREALEESPHLIDVHAEMFGETLANKCFVITRIFETRGVCTCRLVGLTRQLATVTSIT